VVQAGAPLLEIGDADDLELVIDVLSTEAVAIRVGADVVVDRWGGSEPLHGRVERIEPLAFTKISSLGVEEQRVNVIAALDAPAGSNTLGDNYQVEARIVTWQGASALLVASGALFRYAEGWAVYRVVDGRARRTSVTIGRSDGKWVEVQAGLGEGDSVVAYPGDNLSDGSLVRTN
jgi:HlyD family secretion protein